MVAGLATEQKRWTYDDYCALSDDEQYEVIDGELFPMAPGPDMPHQDWVFNLATKLKLHAESRKLGHVSLAPRDVILDDHNIVQPDISFVAAARKSITQRRGIFGAPDMVAEALSPFSVRRDRQVKKELYSRFGVKEFWIIDPGNNGIEILALESGTYRLLSSAVGHGKVRSEVLDIEFDVAEVAPKDL